MTDANKALLDKMIANDKFAWFTISSLVDECAEMWGRNNLPMMHTGLLMTRRAEKNFISDAQPKLSKAEQDHSHSHEFSEYLADLLYSHMERYVKDAEKDAEAV